MVPLVAREEKANCVSPVYRMQGMFTTVPYFTLHYIAYEVSPKSSYQGLFSTEPHNSVEKERYISMQNNPTLPSLFSVS